MSGVGVIGRLLALMAGARLRCRRAVTACLLMEAGSILLATIAPYALKILIDSLQTGRTLDTAAWLSVSLFVIAWTVTTPLGALRYVYSSRITGRMTGDLSTAALSGNLRGGRWRREDSGRTLGLVERLPYSLNIVMDGLIWRTIPLGLQFAISLIIIVRLMSWTYMVCLLGLAAAFVAVSWLGLARQAATSTTVNRAVAACGELVGDVLKNARRVVANGAVSFELAGVGAAFSTREDAEQDMAASTARLAGAQWLVVAAGLFLVVALAAMDVAEGRITPGDFVLLQAYAIRLILPLSGVAFILSQSAGALATVSDVLSFQAPVDPTPTAPHAPTNAKAAHVEVRNLCFSYGKDRGGINDVTLEFPASSFTAIVGANGSGKSTLAQLIAGLLPPASGGVFFNRQPLLAQEGEDRTDLVMYVPQSASLFNRDLGANLSYPPTASTLSDLLGLLQSWRFYDDGRPIDPGTRVGEAGNALSGGQVQKIELARLTGVRVPCLILDESTSALDGGSEGRILAELRKTLGLTTTLIVVTHRAEIVRQADQVAWMRAGHMAGLGAHEDLMKTAEYRQLWNVDTTHSTIVSNE